jgi:hypothetical protein
MPISRPYAYLALIATFLLALSATAQPKKRLKFWLKISNQDGPLQMLGMKRELEPTYEPAVHYKNTSSKEVVGMLISVLLLHPDGKTSLTQSNMDGVWPSERKIPAGGDAWAHELGLRSTTFPMLLKNSHSLCADARILVERVSFADGTEWKRDSRQPADLWADRHATSDPECKSTEMTDEEWSQLTRYSWDPKWSKEIEDDYAKDRDEYAFACTIRPLGRGLVAFCPR